MKTNIFTISKEESLTCKICNKNFTSHKKLVDHIKDIHDINSFEQYIILSYYSNIHPVCKCGCNTKLKFKSLTCGPWFRDYTRNHFPRKTHSKETKEKIRKGVIKTSLEKYGCKNPYMNDGVKEKIKNTKLKKYGDENYNNSKKNKETQLKHFYKLLFENRLNNEYIPLFNLDEYVGIEKKYKFKHTKCGHEFYDSLDNGHVPVCRNCYPLESNKSKYEDELYDFIDTLLPNEIIIRNDKKILNNIYELDIFIPNKKIAIEFNGLYWHSEIGGKKSKKYHLGKTKFCFLKNIRLIHVFEDEWVLKKEIVKNRLKNILGIINKKIYARKCTIKEIDSKTKNNFLNEYHLQGEDKSKIKLGLFYEDELVSVMTFGSLRKSLGYKGVKNTFELIRFVSKYNVIGGASKLLKYFIVNYKPNKIISYADRRWSTGNLYEKIGFKFITTTEPSYWYTNTYITRTHRFNFRKNVLSKKLEQFDPKLSEWQNMQLNNYDRIWDCGTLKYELII